MSEDAISRQAVLDRIEESVAKYGNQYTADMLNMWGLFTQFINEMPSVHAEPKTGHWEKNGKSCICSECGSFALKVETGCLANRHFEPYLSGYCPSCGAKMEEEE